MSELYLHSIICLRGMHRVNFTFALVFSCGFLLNIVTVHSQFHFNKHSNDGFLGSVILFVYVPLYWHMFYLLLASG
jgi:hypothetical protein